MQSISNCKIRSSNFNFLLKKLLTFLSDWHTFFHFGGRRKKLFLLMTISSFFLIWWETIKSSVTKRLHFKKKESRNTWQTRDISYCEWALKIMKLQQEDTFKHYNYWEEMLYYIHALVPNDIMGEILENMSKVLLK